MKIALACKVYPTQRPGGMGFVCQDRARALVELGHEVHVLTTGRDGHKGETLNDNGVEVHHMPCKPGAYTSEFARHCETHCRAFCPDILHSDSFNTDHQHWWKGRPGSPKRTAVTMHGFGWGAYFTQWNLYMRHGGSPPSIDAGRIAIERGLILSFDQPIGISRNEHWQMVDLMAIAHAKLVYNPIAPYFFSNITPATTHNRFLCAAVSGHSERGFKVAQRAAEMAGAQLVVADEVPREDMPRIIDSCLALVLPTCYAQGCDLAVAEAIARHRPVIATATGSYLREAGCDGIYEGAMTCVPLLGAEVLAVAMTALNNCALRVDWSDVRAHLHRPEIHAKNWLEAIL